MFNNFIKKSSKLIAVVLAITLAFSPLSYATPATSLTQFQHLIDGTIAMSDGTITIDNIVAGEHDKNLQAVTQSTTTLTITNTEEGINGVIDAGGEHYHNSGFKMKTGQTTTINNITFKNFYRKNNDYGNVIYNNKGILIINDSIFESNHAKASGGSIYNTGDLTITDTNFSSSTVETSNGGAIYSTSGSTTTITGGEFSYNHAKTDGGAIYNAGTLTINGTTFSSNTVSATNSSHGGGAIYTANNATTIINGSTVFSFNKNNGNTNAFGGAIFNAGNTIVGDGTNVVTFSTNSSTTNGGAIYNLTGTTTTIKSGAVFKANTSQKGGAIVNDGYMEIEDNVEFSSNVATDNSGAIGVWGKSSTEKGILKIGNDAKFYSNQAKDAGAINNKQYSITIVGNDAIFSSNTATNIAGAIYNITSFTIGNGVEFSYNEAKEAGAIYNTGNNSQVQIGEGAIFSYNTAVQER